MRLLLDSTVLIDFLRKRAGAVAFLENAVTAGDELWSVTVVRTEVLGGMRRREETATRELLSIIRWSDVDKDLADSAGELARPWIKSHAGIGVVEFLLAASVELLGARLCTTNLKRFPMYPGLQPPYR